MRGVQLRLDSADRLVELVEERRAPVPALEAARELFALAHAPAGLAQGLLDPVVEADARLRWLGAAVALAGEEAHELPLDVATFVVVDLETTGLSARTDEICEIGAVRVRSLEPVAAFETLVRPRAPLPAAVASLTGIRERDLRGAPPADAAVARFLRFAGDAVLVAHNARFDLSFLDRAVERAEGRRVAGPVVDTVPLARALLGGRVARASLASLAHFFGTSVEPCHRALPDAQATAEILVALIGLAQERGARTVGDLLRIAAPRARRAHDKRSLAFGAPRRPGVYVFRDRHEAALYVGKARDLRARLRSYFGTERLRPAVEAAVGAADRIEWRVLGSELEAGLEELRLIRELRPPGNARGARPDRYVYLQRRGDRLVVTTEPTPLGPIRSRRRAELALRALGNAPPDELDGLSRGAPLPRLRRRLGSLSDALRYEDAARLRDRISALERLVHDLREAERLRALATCVVAPALDDGYVQGFAVVGGRVAVTRRLPLHGGAAVEVDGLLAELARVPTSAALDPDAADELRLVAATLRRPPPEVTVLPLAREPILAACLGGRGAQALTA